MAKKKRSRKRGSSLARRRRAAKKGWAARKARKAARSGKRSRRKGRKHSTKRSRRRARKGGGSFSRRRRAALKGHRRRKARRAAMAATTVKSRRSSRRKSRRSKRRSRRTMVGYKMNPPRRRRRRKAKRSRRSYARAARLGRRRKRRYGTKRARSIARRYRRRYRRNPSFGGGLSIIKGVLKQAVPIGLAILGVNYVTRNITPRLTFLSSLGAFAGPAVAIGMIAAAHFATKKIRFLAKYRQPIMIGTGLIAAKEVASAILPASVKGMLGMGDAISDGLSDYIAVDDYVSVEGMSDYVAVGALEQELGLDQELGFTAELGDVPGGGWSGQANLGGMRQNQMLAPVPGRKFLAPVPARSFTETVPDMTAAYDSASDLYDGIFAGSKIG